MTVCKEAEVVVLENVAEQPIEVIFQDEVQLDINVPLFYIKSGEEEIQAYVNQQAKPQIDDYASLVFSDFQDELDAKTEQACQAVADYVGTTACPSVSAYADEVVCPAVQAYVESDLKSQLQTLVAEAAESAQEAESFAASAQAYEVGAVEQAAAAAESEAAAAASASESAVSAFEASDTLLQVQEIAAALNVDNLLHKSGDESINGVKSFAELPQIPTADVASDTTVPVTTAWIGQKFQVVAELPEEPDENVFYFIREA